MTADPLPRLRGILLATLLLTVAGTLAELFLLEHTEDTWQWVPIVLLALALAVLAGHAVRPGIWSLAAVRVVMALCVVSGAVGVLLHYQGNVEFEREMYPDLTGLRLFREAMMGATPALAPGAMATIGLLGLAWAWRHPAARRSPPTQDAS